ncbi:glutathione synthetase [Pycnococcus provasolii]
MHSRKCATTTATTTKTTSQIKWAARRRALQRRKLVGSTRTPRAAMNDDDVVEPSAGKAFSQQAMTDFCVALACRTGLLYGPPEQCTPAPTTLVPAAFPRASYERAVQLAPAMTRLADATCVDPAWLEQALAAAARADVFTDALIRVRSAAEPTRAAAAGGGGLTLGVYRSDYMVDEPTGRLLQVELNTVASSFGALSTLVSRMHAAALRFASADAEACGTLDETDDSVLPRTSDVEGWPPAPANVDAAITRHMPENGALEGIAAALAAAHVAHGRIRGTESARRHIVFVVQPGETNVHDQRLLADRLWQHHGIPVIRATLAQLARHAKSSRGSSTPSSSVPCDRLAAALRDVPDFADTADGAAKILADAGYEPGANGGRLFYRGREISVAYFRAGYTPNDYPTAVEWAGRYAIEASSAVSCPSLALQLAGTKKVQQDMADTDELRTALERKAKADGKSAREGGVEDDVASLLDAFAELCAPNTDVVARAAADPQAWVLKPQREGGGNNFYGDGLAEKLKSATAEELDAYILMERIRPASQASWMLRSARPTRVQETLQELGVYSASLTYDGQAIKDMTLDGGGELDRAVSGSALGHLLRTKAATSDEGGVAAGFSVLDSPWLE